MDVWQPHLVIKLAHALPACTATITSYCHTPQIKGALLTWLQRDCTTESPALPPFLRNKLAQAIVAIVKREYPAVWPSFFRELVAAAGSGPGLSDMFARIMVAVDEDVISLDIPRWV
jgi:exportin-T